MNNLPAAGRRVPPSQSYSKTSPPPIGTAFGCWVVIENNVLKKEGVRLRPACRVRCSCGKETVCATRTLRQGISNRCKHCAWAATFEKKRVYNALVHPPIPVGAKFGRWTVIENGLRIGKIRAVRLRCQCGTERVLTYFSLRQGDSTSCGCRGKERESGAAWKLLYRSMKRRNEVHLTLSQVKKISQHNCAYCGTEPSNLWRVKYGVAGKREIDPSQNLCYSGIDRIDSTAGYIEGNVVPCCKDCNYAKNKLPLDDFLALIGRIRAHNPTVEGIRRLASSLFAGS